MQYDDATHQIGQIEQQTQALAQQFQALGWGTQYALRGGGFWGNVTSGLGMGAGFGVANALIGGTFNAL